MDNLTTIAEEFALFSNIAIPADAPQFQHTSMRSAFYAGAGAALRNVRLISESAPNALIGMTAVQCMENEVDEFSLARIFEALGFGVVVLHVRSDPGEEQS